MSWCWPGQPTAPLGWWPVGGCWSSPPFGRTEPTGIAATRSRWPSCRTSTGDLARRDFTVNAMAMDRRGRLRDPYGGRKDLEARLLRAVGEPERRFSEDALRILRLARFAAKLGFSVEGETLAAALRLRRETAALSAERITAEVAGFVDGEYFSRAAGEMLGLFAGVWPALAEVPSEMLAAFARAEEPDSRLLFDGPGGLTGGTGRRRWRPSAGGCGCPGAGSGCWTRQPGGWPSRRRRTLPRSGGGPAVSVTKPPAWPLPWTGRWAAPGSRRPPSMSGGGSAGQGCPGASGSWR